MVSNEERKALVAKIANETADKIMTFAVNNEFNMADALITLEYISTAIIVTLARQYAPTNPKMFVSAMMASILTGVINNSRDECDSTGIDLAEELGEPAQEDPTAPAAN
jgi:hypothetical protein